MTSHDKANKGVPKMGIKALLFFVIIVGVAYIVFRIIDKKIGR